MTRRFQDALFPTRRSVVSRIGTGTWRNGPTQIVSGPIGKVEVHYEAPQSNRLSTEMKALLNWFCNPGPMDPILTAGLARFWFVAILPFDDGNGRIARAIADVALARCGGTTGYPTS